MLHHCHHGSRSDGDYDITVAIVGNPNVGKSTLFNVLTGELAHVSNWPGTTVARKEGIREWMGFKIRFVDLPGIYGLSASSLEEVVSREYIVNEKPDLIIALVDATIPERSLYLPIQLLELTPNVVIVFTKVDEMDRLGIHIHFDKLEAMLGVPVIPTSAIKRVGIRELLNTIVGSTRSRHVKELTIDYGGLEPLISEVSKVVVNSKILKPYPTRWVAIRLLEGDKRLEDLLMSNNELEILNDVLKVRESVRRSIGKDPAELVITTRYSFVSSIAREVVVRVEKRAFLEEFIARTFQTPLTGVLASLLLMLISFMFIFSINSGFPMNVIFEYLGLQELAEFIEAYSLSGIMAEVFNVASDYVKELLIGYNPLLASLIGDGVLVGVGAVLSFLPLVFMIFLILSLLEDSGLAPRIAVSFHNILNRFGFSGRSIYPMLVGIGCNVPAVMSSRTVLDDVERLQVISSTPFIPCQARLIVTLALIVGYFKSPTSQTLALFSIYLVGFLIYLLNGLFLRRVVFKVRENPELILELPLIHSPKLKIVWWIAWDYTKHFLKKAGLVILSLSIIVWIITNLGPNGFTEDVTESFGALIGKLLAPTLAPFDILGDSSWILALALLQGFIAKETILNTLAMVYGTADISEAINSLGLTIPQAYSMVLFVTLYVPCLATVATIYQESRSLRATILQILYMMVIAYLIALITYYILRLL